jgi:hypothetical protein
MKIRYSVSEAEGSPLLATGIIGPGQDGAYILSELFRDLFRDYFDLCQRSFEDGLEASFHVHLETVKPVGRISPKGA